jgi:hypothetical protein
MNHLQLRKLRKRSKSQHRSLLKKHPLQQSQKLRLRK